MASFIIKRILRVPPHDLWDCLSDFTGATSPDRGIVVEDPGDPLRHHLGAIRRFSSGGDELREQLVRINPGRRILIYRLLSGAPVRHYIGRVGVEAFGEHSLVTWQVRFSPVFPWPAPLVAGYARRAINGILDELEALLSVAV